MARRDLGVSGAPGVYWVGVHVLGALDGARDTIADGRARTFMPLLPAGPAAAQVRTRLALVVPVKDRIRRGTAGRLLGEQRWADSIATDGRTSSSPKTARRRSCIAMRPRGPVCG